MLKIMTINKQTIPAEINIKSKEKNLVKYRIKPRTNKIGLKIKNNN